MESEESVVFRVFAGLWVLMLIYYNSLDGC